MRPANVLEPIFAAVGDDAEDPGIESAAHFGKVLIRLDEAELQDVLCHVGASRHAERVSVQRVAVPRDQRLERVTLTREYSLNDELIRILIG
jgi:hypothetical protein